MIKRTVVHSKYLPTKMPIVGTVFWLFLLHYFKAPGWVWGFVVTILGLYIVAAIIVVVTEDRVHPSDVVKR